MQKRLAILFSFIFLLSATELHELARIPQLFTHFTHHRAKNPSITVGEFLQLHYQDNHPDDKDENEDRQLPFKSNYTCTSTEVTNVIFIQPESAIFIPLKKQPKTFYREDVPIRQANSIFRPPRLS
jgi:hypothetical protein